MKMPIYIILIITLSSSLLARNIYNIHYKHPRSEPKGLYIANFSYADRYF
jgi:hypothetical protein